MLIEIIDSIMNFYNMGNEVPDSFKYYYLHLYKKQDPIPISNYDISNNKIMNYFWGICLSNRLEIIRSRKGGVSYDLPTRDSKKTRD